MGLKARSFMGWQLVRASGIHGNARVEAVESAMLDEALSGGTVAVIPGFQGVSTDGRARDTGARRVGHLGGRDRRRREGRPLRHLHRRRRRLYHRPADRAAGAQARPGHVRGNARAGRGRRQGAADPLGRPRDAREFAVARAVGIRGQARHRHRRRAFRSGHGKKPDRRHRRRPERGAGDADRGARQAGNGRAGRSARSPRPESRST